MKEKLYTIPLTEAFEKKEECPFCYIANKLEQDVMNFTLGPAATYMESDTRGQTDREGFCQKHYQKMYAYGNTLGNALILHTYYQKLIPAFKKELDNFSAPKVSFMDKLKKGNAAESSLTSFLKEKESSCFICNRVQETYARYLDTFFFLFKTSPSFVSLIKQSKGLCLPHFSDIMEGMNGALNTEKSNELTAILFPIMIKNMERLEEELSWLIDKFDYRNSDAPWNNSKDALPRGIQKISGNHPDQL